MRQSLFLLVLILIAVSIYTAYGLVTFEPDKPYEFTFAEPVLPPGLSGQTGSDTETSPMTPEMSRQTEAAVAQIAKAISIYQRYRKEAPPQAVSTFATLSSAILNGQLPAYLLSSTKTPTGVRSFETLTFDTGKVVALGAGKQEKVVTCKLGEVGTADFVIGDGGDNDVKCDAPRDTTPRDRMLLGGPGNDVITSAAGDVVINGGSGNDTVTVGDGRLLMILEDGWGNDTLTFDCKNSEVFPAEIPRNFPVPWLQKSINFIVLSSRINPVDVTWDGLVLTNRATGDTLSVNQNCFVLVGAGEVAQTPQPAAPPATTP